MTAPYFSYWGKASKDGGYHLLAYHGLDVAAAAFCLLNHRPGLRFRLAKALDVSETALVHWIRFFFSLHDIGKFAEAFQGLIPDLFFCLRGKTAKKAYIQRHDSLGYVFWKAALRLPEWKTLPGGLTSSPKGVLDDWIQAVTGHHGQPPKLKDGIRRMDPAMFFSPEDEQASVAFILDAADLFLGGLDADVETDFAGATSFRPASWPLAGLAVVCDWIGSNADFFPYLEEPLPLDRYWTEHALPNADKAVAASGLTPPRKMVYSGLPHLFEHIKTPTPLQSFCHRQEMPSCPQMWILEDVTGSGKTEAALTLVHRLMGRNQGDGFFVGLPTMATANAMYERMGRAYRRLYEPAEHPSLVLAHGARHLSTLFRQSILPHEDREQRYARCDASGLAECSAWLADHRKKALLADVGVGTVDQAMLGVLPVRHQSMRLLGMADKVLVIDEVHAYDAYMNGLLRNLIRFHAGFGGSVVLLSATLPEEMRAQFVSAFQEVFGDPDPPDLSTDPYPLVTHVTADRADEYPLPAAGIRETAVRIIDDEEAAFQVVGQAVAAGQCVCWIRNTVVDAREAHQRLREADDIPSTDVLLFHSQYALADRLTVEADVLSRFGPDGGPENRRGKILIATQVVEQSLDLDFDVLVSDLAPVDLLIQRAGRQHRHVRDAEGRRKARPGAMDDRPAPVFYVLSPPPVDDPPDNWHRTMFPRAGAVYPHAGRLWLTARMLARLGRIRMPDDARPLIEGVYGASAEPLPEGLEDASFRAEGEAMGKGDMARFNALNYAGGYSRKRNPIWDEDMRVPTRLGEETATLYLARMDNGGLRPWADGVFPWDMSSLRVYISRLSEVSPPTSKETAMRLERLKEEEKALSPESLVAILKPFGGGIWGAEGLDGRRRPVEIRYAKESGLSIEVVKGD